MSKKEEFKYECFICGKKWTEDDDGIHFYKFFNRVACLDHAGIKEWYEEKCKIEESQN